MRKIILLFLALFFVLPVFVSAESLVSGQSDPISLNEVTQTLHSYDGFDYTFKSDGTFRIFHNGILQAKYGFGMSGVYRGNNVFSLSNDYNWNWTVITNTADRIEVEGKRANYDTVPFKWKIGLVLEKAKSLKIKNYVENTTAFNVTDLNFFYLFDVNTAANPTVSYYDDTNTYREYSYHTNQLKSSRTELAGINLHNIDVPFFSFQFQDLIDNNYFLTYLYFGNLKDLKNLLPDSNGYIVGFSKGNGMLAAGQSHTIDPSIFVGLKQGTLLYQNRNSVEVIKGTSYRYMFIGRNFYYSTNNGVNWGTFNILDDEQRFRTSMAIQQDTNVISIIYRSGLIWYYRECTVTGIYNCDSNSKFSPSLDITTSFQLATNVGVQNDDISSSIAYSNKRLFFVYPVGVGAGAAANQEQLKMLHADGNNQIVSNWIDDGNVIGTNGTYNFFQGYSLAARDDNVIAVIVAKRNANSDYNFYFSVYQRGILTHKDVLLPKEKPNEAVQYPEIALLKDTNKFLVAHADQNVIAVTAEKPILTEYDFDTNTQTAFDLNTTYYAGVGYNQTNNPMSIAVDSNDLALIAYNRSKNTSGDFNSIYFYTYRWSNSGLTLEKIIQADTNFFRFADISNNVDGNFSYVYYDKNDMIWYDQDIDKNTPSTSWDGNHNIWQNFDANIHLTCNDNSGSGCFSTKYRLDTDSGTTITYGNWTTFDTNILVKNDGNYAIDFNSTDVAGNIGDTNTFYVLIDKTAPTTTDNHVGGWFNSNQTITLTCTDTNSGCATTQYRVDSAAWQTGTSVSLTTDGNHQVDYNSTDNAGNIETTKTFWVGIDKTAPIVSVVYPNGGNYLRRASDLNFTFSDATSGILDANVYVSLTAGAKTNLIDSNFLFGNNRWITKYYKSTVLNQNDKIKYYVFADENNFFVNSINGGGVLVFDASDNSFTKALTKSSFLTHYWYVFADTNFVYFTGDDNAVFVFNRKTTDFNSVLETNPDGTVGSYPNGLYSDENHVYAAHRDYNVYIWDKNTLTLRTRLSTTDLGNNDTGLMAVKSDNNNIYAVGEDCNLHVWNKNTFAKAQTIPIMQNCSYALGFYLAQLEQDNDYLYTHSSWDLNIFRIKKSDWSITRIPSAYPALPVADTWFEQMYLNSNYLFVALAFPDTKANNPMIQVFDANTLQYLGDLNFNQNATGTSIHIGRGIYGNSSKLIATAYDEPFQIFNLLADGNYFVDVFIKDKAGNTAIDSSDTSFYINSQPAPILDNNSMSVALNAALQPQTNVYFYVDVNVCELCVINSVLLNFSRLDGTDANYAMSFYSGNTYRAEIGGPITQQIGTYKANYFFANDNYTNSSQLFVNMYFRAGLGGNSGGLPPNSIGYNKEFFVKKQGESYPSSLEKTVLFFPFYNHSQLVSHHILVDYPVKFCNSDANQVVCLLDGNTVNVSIRLDDEPILFRQILTDLNIDGNILRIDYSYLNVGYYIVFEVRGIGQNNVFGLVLLNDYLFKVEEKSIGGIRIWWIVSIILLLFFLVLFSKFSQNDLLLNIAKALLIFGILIFALLTIALFFSGIMQTAIINFLIVIWVIIILVLLFWVF